jgi:translation elongation factor EF-1alpha
MQTTTPAAHIVVGLFGPQGHGKTWNAGKMFLGPDMTHLHHLEARRFETELTKFGRSVEDLPVMLFDTLREEIERGCTILGSRRIRVLDNPDPSGPSLSLLQAPGNLKFMSNITALARSVLTSCFFFDFVQKNRNRTDFSSFLFPTDSNQPS